MSGALNKRRVRDIRPFETLSPANVEKLLRSAGYFAPDDGAREGVDALCIRLDVTLADSVESLSSLLRHALGVVAQIARNTNADDYVSEAACAAEFLLRVAAGHLALIDHGLHLVSGVAKQPGGAA